MAENVLQFVWIFSEFLHRFFRILFIELFDALHYIRTDGHGFVMSLYIFQTAPFDRYGRRVVSLTLHLVDIPVGLQITEVAHTHIGAVSFHFLVVPQWEGVVVSVSKDNRISFFRNGVQVVLSEFAGYIASATVVVIPCLAHHLDRNEQSKNGCKDSTRLFSDLLFQPTCDTCHTHTYPDGEGIERTGIRIVSFTRLERCLIQVKHNGQTGHEEEEEYHPELLDTLFAFVGLPEQTDESENQRQAEEYIVSFIILQVRWKEFLVAYQYVVDERNAGNPISVFNFAMTLDVVLTTGKVP